ncbi:DUF2341 domain-containing protein, partial [bacterium]|nr:DUF2341 domain-containing protein [bacterium]
MKKKPLISVAFLLMLYIAPMIFISSFIHTAISTEPNIDKDFVISADWYNESWVYRKSVEINDGVSSAGYNYTVKVNVPYDSDMQTDFDDIRFTDDDKFTLLDYWRETYIASTNATFWVKISDYISWAGLEFTIYMYYGNDAVSTTSNGDNTFIDFMDFEEGDTTDVNVTTGTAAADNTHVRSGSYSLELSDYPPSSTGGISYPNDFFDDYALRGWFYDDGDTSADIMHVLELSADTNFRIGVYTGQSTTHYIYSDGTYHTTSIERSVG